MMKTAIKMMASMMMVAIVIVMLTTLTNASTRLANRATPLKLGKAT